MSNTKRKIRRRRQHLNQHWDLIATKALLLGDDKVAAAAAGTFFAVRRGSDPGNVYETYHWADSWMLQQMNIKPTSKSRERLRAALLRTRQ